jgi:DNA polymerase III subunit delta'
VNPPPARAGRAGFPPWLEPHLASLVTLVRSEHTPSGLLMVGPEGVGKGVLARTFLQRVACTHDSEGIFPCGVCNGCRSFLGASHPEILEVVPEEAGKEILVDQVRAVIEFLSLSHAGPARVVFIEPAEAMNVNAANALLKTLEEPPAGAMVLLAAARPARLPPTIRSRCRRLRIPSPDTALVRRWLESMQGRALTTVEALAASLNRPLDARALLEDDGAVETWRQDRQALESLLNSGSPFPVVEHFVRCNLHSLLPRLQRLLVSLQTYLATDQWDDFAQLFEIVALTRFARDRDARELSRLFQDSLQWQRDLPAPLNPQSRCEHIVLRFWRRGG